jgi:hypothetical protein
MADLKISELTELPPFDSNTQEGGIANSDYLPILDQSETDITLINKKVRVSTLHENLAPIDTPVFTGTPFSTTPPPGNNSTRIATTAFVQNEISSSLTLDSLQDVTNPSTPEANQILIFDDLTGTFIVRSITSTNREVLTSTKVLTSSSSAYQFLDSNGANRDVILPPGISGLRFVIKNLDTSNSLLIKESAGGSTQAVLNIDTPICEVVHDGVEFHIILF